MNRILRSISLLILAVLATAGFAQPTSNSDWAARLLNPDVRAGESTQIIFEATITPEWHIYGPQLTGYWISTTGKLSDENTAPVSENGEMVWPNGAMHQLPDETGEGLTDVVWYENQVAIGLPITIDADATGTHTITASIRTQACNDELCDPPIPLTLEIPITIAEGEPREEFQNPILEVPPQPAGYKEPEFENSWEAFSANGGNTDSGSADNSTGDAEADEIVAARGKGIVPFFLFAFVTGLLALLTPCVWPMIPVTVSYFSKKQEDDPLTPLSKALAYGIGIIFTFVGLGLVTAVVFGAAGGPQVLAANVWVNLFMFLLFVVLALNLFGYYEIMIPTKFVNKVQGKTKAGGFVAPILLGFVFSLTSFTCTVPFVGAILVGAAAGDLLFPIVGMLGFSLAFAIPFFLLALAPNAAAKLPRSGTWMNTIKGFLGFVELAAAMKFLSNAELTFNLQILTFPVYMAIWAFIFGLSAMMLFGLIKIPNDEGGVVGWGRRTFGVAMIGLTLFLLGSINKPEQLGTVAAFAPPTVYPGSTNVTSGGLTWQHTYDKALAKAQEENKPVFLNFTGVTCANCRVMEAKFRNNEDYQAEMKNFVLAELYTDRGTEEDNANAKLREDLTNTAANPVYVIVKPDGTYVKSTQGLAKSDETFINFLKQGYNEAKS